MLTGQTELILGALAVGPSEYALEPWTPTILGAPRPVNLLGAKDSGTAVLRVGRVSPRTDRPSRLGASRAPAFSWARIHPRPP